MNFPDALKYILSTASGKVARKIWQGTNQYIMRDSKLGVIAVMNDLAFQYLSSGIDMTAEDWYIVE